MGDGRGEGKLVMSEGSVESATDKLEKSRSEMPQATVRREGWRRLSLLQLGGALAPTQERTDDGRL